MGIYYPEEILYENYINKDAQKITSNQSNNGNQNTGHENEYNPINYENSNKSNQELSKEANKENSTHNEKKVQFKIQNSGKKNTNNNNLQSSLGLHSRSIENLQKLENINANEEKSCVSDDEEEKISTKKNNNEDEKDENTNIIIDNLKAVFTNRIKNNVEDDDIQSCFSNSINSEYELNYYKNPDMIRNAYFSRLIMKRVWVPTAKPKTHNSLIILDWDDTLLPTSFYRLVESLMKILN